MSSTATVTLTAGTVSNSVYGGCNSAGTIEGKATVNVNGGTIGSGTFTPATKTLTYATKGNVFGGGYGENTFVKGDVEVNIGTEVPPVAPATDPTYSGTATIWGDVYGGSALGKVNASMVESVLTATAGKTTAVNLYKGTL